MFNCNNKLILSKTYSQYHSLISCITQLCGHHQCHTDFARLFFLFTVSASGFKDRFVFSFPPIVAELPTASGLILLLLGPLLLLLLLPLLLPLTVEIFVVICDAAFTTTSPAPALDVEGTA